MNKMASASSSTTLNSEVAGSPKSQGMEVKGDECAASSAPPPKPQYPWMICAMGSKCVVPANQEVTLLPCLHVLCSGRCFDKFLEEVKPGSSLECRVCRTRIDRNKLTNKIIPDKEFGVEEKFVEEVIICENCIFDLPATSYCQDCPSSLCNDCVGLHPRARATANHIIQPNLDTPKMKKIENFTAKQNFCQSHKGQKLTSICATCTEKVCDQCLANHFQHEVFNVQAAKENLSKRLKVAEDLVKKCDELQKHLQAKKADLLNNNWNEVLEQCRNEFAMMMSILASRQKEIIREAKLAFIKKKTALENKNRILDANKTYISTLVTAGKNVMDEMSDTAAINFSRYSKNNWDWVSDYMKRINQESNQFLEKSWYFALDKSTIFQAQKYLKNFCQIEYTFQPKIQTLKVDLKTYGKAKRNGNGINNEAPVEIVEPSASVPRTGGYSGTNVLHSVARKSTGGKAPRVSAVTPMNQNLSLSTNNFTVMAKHYVANIEMTPLLDPEPDPNYDIRTLTDTMTQNQTNGTSHSSDVLQTIEIQNSRSLRRSSGRLDKKNIETMDDDEPLENTVEQQRRDVDSNTRRQPIPDPLNGKVLDTNEPDRHEACTNSTNTPKRNAVLSPQTSDSSAEFGAGKRQRKKKSFPDFVDTEQSFKILKARQAEELLLSETPSGRPSRKSGAQPPSKMAKLQAEDDEQSGQEELNQDPETNDESKDDSDTPTARVLRRRTINESDPDISRSVTPIDSPPKSERPKSRARSRSNSAVRSRSKSRGRTRSRSSRGRQTPNPRSDVSAEAAEFVSKYNGAPIDSIEDCPEQCDYPEQGHAIMKHNPEDENDDYCSVCLDGGGNVFCCDGEGCTKVFHKDCHIPPICRNEEIWHCNYHTTKETVQQKINSLPKFDNSEEWELLEESNAYEYLYACKFLVECYKIPSAPTVRWEFPRGYFEKYGKVPYHLKYIRERLCFSKPKSFSSVKDMLLTMKQMFEQAFHYYGKVMVKKNKKHVQQHARACYVSFLGIVEKYYPTYRNLFDNLDPVDVDL